DVVCGDQVGAQHRADHLRLVLVALRPERPDRAVDHARGQDRALCRPSFTLEEAAGDLACRVHALLDVDGEREEVRTPPPPHPSPPPPPPHPPPPPPAASPP